MNMKPYSVLILFCLFSSLLFSQTFEGESVTYDPDGNRFFSGSDNTSIVQRAANGEVSYFGSGLNADYGMEVMNGVLYAVSGSRVYGYDLITEMEVTAANVPGSQFLNGLGSDPATNRVWVSDFSAGRIIEIDFSDFASPVVNTVVANTQGTPNGVWFDAQNNRLLYTLWGANASIKEVDIANAYAVSTAQTTNLGNIDGIDENNQGELYISSWSPVRISKFSSDLSMIETITAPGISNPADIEYALEIDTLAIPNGNGEVSFIGFNVVGLEESVESGDLSLFPNPVSSSSILSFNLLESCDMEITILGSDGKLVKGISSDFYPVGLNRVIIDTESLSAGLYFIKVSTEENSAVQRMLIVR
jgi:sugar lactone lactonase YvrE